MLTIDSFAGVAGRGGGRWEILNPKPLKFGFRGPEPENTSHSALRGLPRLIQSLAASPLSCLDKAEPQNRYKP